MPAGPHLRSVREIRKVLEEIPDAIRFEDPLSERTGVGHNPATEIWISDPDRNRHESDAVGLNPGLDSEQESEEGLLTNLL
jgi:hypothetical protein